MSKCLSHPAAAFHPASSGATSRGSLAYRALRLLVPVCLFPVASAAASGELFSQSTYPSVAWPSAVTVGEVTGDGLLDVIVTSGIGSFTPQIWVHAGQGDGTIAPAGLLLTLESGSIASLAKAVHVVDMNDDGAPDLAGIMSDNGGKIFVAPRTPGGFADVAYYTVCGSFHDAAFARLNADRSLDVAAVGTCFRVDVLLNDAGGGLAHDGWYKDPLNYVTSRVATGDFDGDGHRDLVYTDAIPPNVIIHFNAGDATFAAFTTLTAGDGAGAVVCADFDSDGKDDIAVAAAYSHGVFVFAPALGGQADFYPTGAWPADLATADFNLDGHVDIAVTDRTDNTLRVLLNDGQGGFVMLDPIEVGIQPGKIAVGDLNGDGAPDLIIANAKSDSLSILINKNNPPCPEDLDGDGYIGQGDLGILLGHYGQTVAPGTNGDLNGDGQVNQADLGQMLGKYGQAC